MSTVITRATRFIRISDLLYPLQLQEIRRQNQTVSLPGIPTEQQILDLGYAVVHPTPQASGDVVTEGTPVLTDGVWTQTWNVREFNEQEKATALEQKRQELKAQARIYEEKLLGRGVAFTFPGDVINHIQCRDGDIGRMTRVRLRAQNNIADDVSTVEYIRTYENNVFAMTPQEIIAMTDAMDVGYKSMLADLWTLKDLIAAAEDFEDFPEIPDFV